MTKVEENKNLGIRHDLNFDDIADRMMEGLRKSGLCIVQKEKDKSRRGGQDLRQ